MVALAHRPQGFGLIAWVQNTLETIRATRARYAAFSRAYAELNQMGDDELAEYGLHRSDLVDMAWRQVDARG
ncbi:DUF1127 domain-containing protein [Ruegeria sp. HKCCD8929]|uniref:DUF1127 domain-containing protein n=1 Tax=Ruegeria sp. HKCCD8929 TaxID=2683006 RepID=UPI001489769C|nr:DUF1127 domain-containing protein [Ruegeria sp. HKCCD8929]